MIDSDSYIGCISRFHKEDGTEMSRKVTIYDLAEKLGLSTATINRELNVKPNVGEETLKLVLEAAKDMGYRANRAAMSLP
jgi:LacI family transcriptional regulator